MRSYYDILGVDPEADAAEIQSAYRQLARTFHPDKHAGAPEAVQRHASDVMSTINEAYRTLSDPGARADYDAHLDGRTDPAGPSAPTVRPPRHDECLLCGSFPAVQVEVQRRVGMVFWRRVYGYEGPMCRDCGLELVRAMTSRTLVAGWWGVISFFANFLTLITNFHAWTRLRRLDAPRSREGVSVVAPLPHPMPDGKPLWQRAGFLVFAGVVGLAVLSGASQQPPPSSLSTPSTNSGQTVGASGTNPESTDTSQAPTSSDVAAPSLPSPSSKPPWPASGTSMVLPGQWEAITLDNLDCEVGPGRSAVVTIDVGNANDFDVRLDIRFIVLSQTDAERHRETVEVVVSARQRIEHTISGPYDTGQGAFQCLVEIADGKRISYSY